MISKGSGLVSAARQFPAFVIVCVLFELCAWSLHAQSGSGADAEALQKRLARARALSAAHSLAAAASELSSIAHSTTDEAVREVARIMLMGVYSEEADYMQAESLLEEVFKSRSHDEGSLRTYFALAGRAVSGAREHLDRYRAFGINVADTDLPAESVKDLDRLRSLLERIAAQAREIGTTGSRTTDATALLEDVARVRYTLARDDDEKLRWQQEFGGARQELAASETHVTMSQDPTTGSGGSNSVDAEPAQNKPTQSPNSVQVDPDQTPGKNGGPSAAGGARSATEASTTRASDPHGTTGAAGLRNGTNGTVVLNVGSLVAKATDKISPSYPSTAKSAHVSGVVTVYLVVNEKGAVAEVGDATGPILLRQAAVDAAWRWRFHPTLVDGRAVRVSGFINFNFAL